MSTGLVFYLARIALGVRREPGLARGAAVASKDPSSSWIGQQLPWIVLALVVLGAAAPTPWRAGFGARAAWPGPRRGMRTTRGAVVYALLLTLVVGSIAAAVTDATGTAVHSVGEVYASFDWTARILSSLRAALWGGDSGRRDPGRARVRDHSGRRAPAATTASSERCSPGAMCATSPACSASSPGFTPITLYQGPVAASFVVLVGVGRTARLRPVRIDPAADRRPLHLRRDRGRSSCRRTRACRRHGGDRSGDVRANVHRPATRHVGPAYWRHIRRHGVLITRHVPRSDAALTGRKPARSRDRNLRNRVSGCCCRKADVASLTYPGREPRARSTEDETDRQLPTSGPASPDRPQEDLCAPSCENDPHGTGRHAAGKPDVSLG